MGQGWGGGAMGWSSKELCTINAEHNKMKIINVKHHYKMGLIMALYEWEPRIRYQSPLSPSFGLTTLKMAFYDPGDQPSQPLMCLQIT